MEAGICDAIDRVGAVGPAGGGGSGGVANDRAGDDFADGGDRRADGFQRCW